MNILIQKLGNIYLERNLTFTYLNFNYYSILHRSYSLNKIKYNIQ